MNLPTSSSDSLSQYRVSELPETCYYIPNFLTSAQEEEILTSISKLPPTKWTVLSRRRLLSLPSPLTGTARDTLIDAPMPSFLTKLILDRFAELQIFALSTHSAPNHCLVNEYQPGQGIMPHEDGPAYYPLTATVSLASHTVLNIYEKTEEGERQAEPRWKILQESGSLLVTMGRMYKDTLHSISEVERDANLGPENIVNWTMLGDSASFSKGSAQRTMRISLTYRDVTKLAKLGGALKFMKR